MEFDDLLNNTAFWVLTAVGIGAVVIMLTVLSKMGQSSIMPFWVKIAAFIAVPVAAAIFSGYAQGN